MANEPTAKWAGETYAFMALFRRTSRRLPGLLLMQLAWALLLALVATLGKVDNALPVIGIPTWNGFQSIRLADLYIIGAIALLFIWFMSSGCWRFVYLPLARLLRPLLSAILLAIVLLIFIIALPFFLVEYIRLQIWERRQPPERRAELKKLPHETEDAVYRKETKFHLDQPFFTFIHRIQEVRRNIASSARIALVPFFSYTIEEEQKAAKAPLQVFAAAIRRLRLSLANLPSISHVRFTPLPPVLRIESDDAARRWLRFLGLDTLLWGSYVSTNPPLVWLNVQYRTSREENTGKSDERDARHPLEHRRPDDSMMIVNQDNAVETTLVILIAYLRTLHERSSGPALQLFSRFQWYKGFDQLRLAFVDQNRTFVRLAGEMLAQLRGPLSRPNRLDPTPQELFVRHASNWAVEQISRFRDDRIHNSMLADILRHCIRLEPDRAEHRYRFGALLCLMGDASGALESFRQGQKLDEDEPWSDSEWISIMASVNIEIHLGSDEAASVSAIAYVARALVLGGKQARERATEAFQKTLRYTELFVLKSQPTAGDRVLCTLLQLQLPTAGEKLTEAQGGQQNGSSK